MSHTMHRLSDSHDDFIIHVRRPKNASPEQGKLLAPLLRDLSDFHPVNLGSPRAGTLLTSSIDHLIQTWPDGAPIHVVFDSEENFISALYYLRKANTGLSVSVSVPWETAERLSDKEHFNIAGYQADLTPSALEEEDWISRICSLCGHLRISPARIKYLAEKIHLGAITPEQAAIELGKNCLCGCFNTSVASHLFKIGIKENNNI